MVVVNTVNTDGDGIVYTGKYRNYSIDNIRLLDRNYGYDDIFPKVLDVFLDSGKGWKKRVTEIAGIVGDYKVSIFDDISAAHELAENSKIPDEIKTVLERISPTHLNVFTGSLTTHMSLHVKKLKPIIPNTKIRVFGTNLEQHEGKYTGKVLEMWDSSKRAEKAKELTGDKNSIGFGHNRNDIPLLEVNKKSYFISGPVTTKIYNGFREGPIIYTDMKSLPFKVDEFLKQGVING